MLLATMSAAAAFFFSSRRRHTRSLCDWSSDVCSSDLIGGIGYHEDVGDVGILDDLPRPQTSRPLRRQPGAAQQHLDLRKPWLRLRRIELIRVGPALGSPRPLFRKHETALLFPTLPWATTEAPRWPGRADTRPHSRRRAQGRRSGSPSPSPHPLR